MSQISSIHIKKHINDDDALEIIQLNENIIFDNVPVNLLLMSTLFVSNNITDYRVINLNEVFCS